MVQNQKDMQQILTQAGLRPTRQRLALAQLLFARGHHHITAEMLHEQALTQGITLSLATVYNTLHQFTDAGLLRDISVDGSKTYFDTNLSEHHHFFVEDDQTLIDCPKDHVHLTALPDAPKGMDITRVDVVVRVRRNDQI